MGDHYGVAHNNLAQGSGGGRRVMLEGLKECPVLSRKSEYIKWKVAASTYIDLNFGDVPELRIVQGLRTRINPDILMEMGEAEVRTADIRGFLHDVRDLCHPSRAHHEKELWREMRGLRQGPSL